MTTEAIISCATFHTSADSKVEHDLTVCETIFSELSWGGGGGGEGRVGSKKE